jgi:voltage-gated potassium channel
MKSFLRPTRRPANGSMTVLTPVTTFGQLISSAIMIIGYGIIAVPTDIVSVELAQAFKRNIFAQACLECSAEGHDWDAKFCKYCGARL